MIRRVCVWLMLVLCGAALWGCEEEGRCVTEADCFRGEVCASGRCTTRADMSPALDLGADQAIEPDSAPDLGEDMASDMMSDMAGGCGVGLARCGDVCVPCGEGAADFTCERGDRCTITACRAGYTLSGAAGGCVASEHTNPVLVGAVRDAWAAYSPAGRAHVVVSVFSGGRDKLYVRSWSPDKAAWESSPEVDANEEVSVASDTRGQLHVATVDGVDDMLYHRWDGRWETMTLPIKTRSARLIPLADGDMWFAYLGADARSVMSIRWSASTQSWGVAREVLRLERADQFVGEMDVVCGVDRCTMALSSSQLPAPLEGSLQIWSAPFVDGEPMGWAMIHTIDATVAAPVRSFEQVRLKEGSVALAHLSFVALNADAEQQLFYLPILSAAGVGGLSAGSVQSGMLTGVAPAGAADAMLRAVGSASDKLFSRDPTMMGWPEQGVRVAEPGVSHELVSDGEGWWWLYDVNSTENSSLQVLRLVKLQ